MRPFLRWCVAVVFAGSFALAQPFTGTWAGPSGQVVLTQEGLFVDGTALIEGRRGRVHGAVFGDELVALWAASGAREIFLGTAAGPFLSVSVEGAEPRIFKRAPEARRPARAAEATKPPTPTPAEKKPKNALDVELCATSAGPGPAWTRRLVLDGTGHLSVGEDLAPRRRDDPAAPRRFWVQDVGHYDVQGHRVSLRLGDGQQKCLAGSKDAAGRVSELLCGGWLYEAATCQAPPPAR